MPTLPKTPLQFTCGAEMQNRFMLAPLTNQQSHENGQLSEEEFKSLVRREFQKRQAEKKQLEPRKKGL